MIFNKSFIGVGQKVMQLTQLPAHKENNFPGI